MKTKSQPPGTERSAKIKNVIRVSSGNFLEMYDFIVFGFFAGPIGRTFFPGHNPYASLGGKTSEVATTEYFGSVGMAHPHSLRHPLFRRRWFTDEVIITCVRSYLRFSLCYREVEELLAVD